MVVTILLRAGGTVDDPLIVDSGGSSPVPHAQPSQPKKHIAIQTPAQPSQPKKHIAIQTPAQPWLQMIKRIAALAAALFLCWAVLPAPPPPPPPRPRAPAGGTYGPLIAAGDAAVLSAQGVLRLCKEEKHCTAVREQLSYLTRTQRRKLGVTIWLTSLTSFASLALPSTPLAVLGRSALFAPRAPPAAATLTTVAVGGAAKARVGSRTARAAAAATATAAAAAASKTGAATLPASLLRSPAAARTYHLVLELTRRSGTKCVLLEVPLPRAANPVTNRLLASFPGLAY